MRPYLELVRVFLTPTAIADSYAGYVLAATLTGAALAPDRMALVAVASVLLYWLGMIANDLFDLQKDRRTAPNRPVASGAVPVANAVVLAAICASGAVALAWVLDVGPVALSVVGAVLLYDGGAKRIPWLGNLVMGSCRSGNLLLGAATAVGTTATFGEMSIVIAATLLGVFIALVTAVSELEDHPWDRRRFLRRALLAFALPVALVAFRPASVGNWLNALLLAGLLIRALRGSLQAPAAGPHGAAIFVRQALGTIFIVDAGVLLACGKGAIPPQIVGLYALWAIAWMWKRAYLRRGLAGS